MAYGPQFGATDDALAELVGGIRSREQLITDCDIVLLPKVQAEDLTELSVGQVVWGCVQVAALTQIAIDRRLTLIGFEAMNHWQADGGFGLHVFHKNNELAGLLLSPARHATGRSHRQLRSASACFGHRVRRDRSRRGHRIERPRKLTMYGY